MAVQSGAIARPIILGIVGDSAAREDHTEPGYYADFGR